MALFFRIEDISPDELAEVDSNNNMENLRKITKNQSHLNTDNIMILN